MNVVALPQTDASLTAEIRQSAGNTSATTALVYAIINAHFDFAAMLPEKGATEISPVTSGMAALLCGGRVKHACSG